ncbi:hypothetical protein [Brachyspira pilosicoli]|uniref:hypothetical protein n=1 Tax=Brachyspira pilosicoli TaxID=52584 RepID=UPI000E19DB3D|nr:hypothetical protein [Brachyspira pilosicoli]SUW05973.1 Uncharacterised protein [Brachyspira pilosicoli]
MKSIGDSLKRKEEQKLEKIGKKPVCVFDDGKTRRFKNVFLKNGGKNMHNIYQGNTGLGKGEAFFPATG